MQLKCWLDGTYLDRKLLNAEIGKEVVSYGVGPKNTNYGDEEFVYFKYYQWIVPMLLLQTLALSIPRILWRTFEKGTMKKLLEEVSSPVFTENWVSQRKNLIAYVKTIKKKYHRSYAFKYMLCELLTIIVILFNMFTMQLVLKDFWNEYKTAVSAFFRGDFSAFGREAARMFPIQAKCLFDVIGDSGSIQRRDALCILPQNVFNEKVFAVLYVWYIFILCCAILNLVYLIVMCIFKILRIFNIGHMLERTVSIRECKEISGNGDVGLWFTLSIYRKNLVPTFFQDVCDQLRAEIKHEKKFEKSLSLEYEDIEKYS